MSDRCALIIDDSKSARFALRRSLESYQFRVETAESASEAMVALRQGIPDIIFLDHIMPDAEGLDVLRGLRERQGTANVPIIICSADEGPEFNSRARQADADGVVGKPPDPRQLKDIVQLLESGQLRPGASDSAQSHDPGAPPAFEEMTMTPEPEPEMHVYQFPGADPLTRLTISDGKIVRGERGSAPAPSPPPPPPPSKAPPRLAEEKPRSAPPPARTPPANVPDKPVPPRTAPSQIPAAASAAGAAAAASSLLSAPQTPQPLQKTGNDKTGSSIADDLSSVRAEINKSLEQESKARMAIEERIAQIETVVSGRLEAAESRLEALQASVDEMMSSGAANSGQVDEAQIIDKAVTAVLAKLTQGLR